MDFEQRRWISCVKKNGSVFLSSRDEYKAKFILHLRCLRLTDEEIGKVMDAEEPIHSPGFRTSSGDRWAYRLTPA
jgi:hypothetical protein